LAVRKKKPTTRYRQSQLAPVRNIFIITTVQLSARMGYTKLKMLSGVFIGVLVGVSVATWGVYNTMTRTGNNTKSSITTGAIAGLFGFVITVTVVAMIDSQLGN